MSEEDLFEVLQGDSGLTYDSGDYQEKTDHEHVLDRPNVYIGNVNAEDMEIFIAKLEDDLPCLKKENVRVSEGLERILLEALSNAGDNAVRSKAAGVNPGTLKVDVEARMFQVWNSGRTIPVVMKETLRGSMWTPTFIFQELRTSSNYDDEDDKMWGGVNGFGIKLANIFATEMVVEVGDPVNQLHFKQIWTGNKYFPEDPIITKYTKKQPFVQVSVRPDLARLGAKNLDEPLEAEVVEFRRQLQRLAPKLVKDLPEKPDRKWFVETSRQDSEMGDLVARFRPHLQGELSEQVQGLFFRHTLDASFICGIPVQYNGKTFNLKQIKNFAQLYFGETSNSYRLREWPDGTELKPNGDPVSPTAIPTLDVLLLDTPNAGNVVSFANGMMTYNGGQHVEFVYKTCSKLITDYMNSRTFSGVSTEKAKALSSLKVSLREVRQHLSILVVARVPNPQWDSQSKRSLKGGQSMIDGKQVEFKLSLSIPKNFMDKVKSWGMIEALENHMFGQLRGLMKKSDGTKKSKIKVDAGQDAFKAGGKDSQQCSLYVAEGNSAVGFLRILISRSPGNWDYFGVLPLRGKPINVMKAKLDQIAENRELTAIKQWLGLREGVDYTEERWFQTLRYGELIIAADADDDGYHILLLVLAIFHKFYPSLLQRGYVKYYRTPLFVVKHNNQQLRFFSNLEFDTWRSSTPGFKMTDDNTFRNKGLGGFGPAQARSEYEHRKMIRLEYDWDASSNMRVVFSSDTQPRKEWLDINWDRGQVEQIIDDESGTHQDISDVIDTAMFGFAGTALKRGICDITGLKRAHKQALWGLMVHYDLYAPGIKDIGARVRKLSKMKVCDASSAAKTITHYEHGPTSMEGTLIKMGQEFVGANNIPLIFAIGTWGSREANGSDHASSRYISLKLAPCVPWIFRREFVPVLQFRNSEDGDINERMEPKVMPSVIPMGLINGVRGMGIGHSTTFPMFRPRDVIGALEDILTGKSPRELSPYFRHFKGTVTLKRKLTEEAKENIQSRPTTPAVPASRTQKLLSTDDEEEDDDKEDLSGSSDYEEYWEILGNFEWFNDGTVVISELPPYRSVESYKKYLKTLEENKIIKSYKTNCLTGRTDDKDRPLPDIIKITIYGLPYEMANVRDLHLRQVIGTNNLKVLNDNDYPVRFHNIYHYLQIYTEIMLDWYQLRKEREIADLEEKTDKMIMRRDYIQVVLDGDLELWKPSTGKKKVVRSKKDIYADMQKLNFPEDQCPALLRTGTDKFTEEEVASLDEEIHQMETLIRFKKTISINHIWLNDLDDFKRECPELMF